MFPKSEIVMLSVFYRCMIRPNGKEKFKTVFYYYVCSPSSLSKSKVGFRKCPAQVNLLCECICQPKVNLTSLPSMWLMPTLSIFWTHSCTCIWDNFSINDFMGPNFFYGTCTCNKNQSLLSVHHTHVSKSLTTILPAAWPPYTWVRQLSTFSHAQSWSLILSSLLNKSGKRNQVIFGYALLNKSGKRNQVILDTPCGCVNVHHSTHIDSTNGAEDHSLKTWHTDCVSILSWYHYSTSCHYCLNTHFC